MTKTEPEHLIFGAPVRGRSCGSCKLCCTLVPAELDDGWTKAGERCKHVRSKGCGIYARRPSPCRYWSCRWLFDPATATLRRPDQTHYVIDPMPDEIKLSDPDAPEPIMIPVLQVWVDPAHKDAWRDPQLLIYLDMMGAKHGFATLLRYDNERAVAVFPPSLSEDGEWHVQGGEMSTDIGYYSRHPEGARPPL